MTTYNNPTRRNNGRHGTYTQKNTAYKYRSRTDDFYRRSVEAKPTRTRRDNTVTMPRWKYLDNLKRVAIGAVLATVLTFAGGHMLVDSIHENHVLGDATQSYASQVIAKETHRTADGQNYYYDYDHLAERLQDPNNNIDTEIFFMEANMGSLQTGRVLQAAGMGTFTEYINSKGFNSVEKYEDYMDKVMFNQLDGKSNQDELRKMQEEHDINIIDNANMNRR